jgi:uncharacterized protein
MNYKRRYLHDILSERPTRFKAILITGPRRSGKSTLTRELLKEWGGRGVAQFDTVIEQGRFTEDPEGFLKDLGTPAVLDEIQNVPQVLSYLKKRIDIDPEGSCDYILTGSHQFHMMRHVSESLAGRVLVKELLPFCVGEVHETSFARATRNLRALFQLDAPNDAEGTPLGKGDVIGKIVVGGFPQAIACGNDDERNEWFNSYLTTYVQRDIRSLSNLQNLGQFSRFVQLIAGRTSKLVNYSELGKDISVSYKTAQHYLSLLESSYLWASLPPYFQTASERRISKSPKGVFLDTGLAAHLTGLTSNGLERNPLFGPLFESFVITELQKLINAIGTRATLLHFRAGDRVEVDLVIETGGKIIPIEIKASATIDASWSHGIKAFREIVGIHKDSPGYVISLNPRVEHIAHNVFNVPLHSLC